MVARATALRAFTLFRDICEKAIANEKVAFDRLDNGPFLNERGFACAAIESLLHGLEQARKLIEILAGDDVRPMVRHLTFRCRRHVFELNKVRLNIQTVIGKDVIERVRDVVVFSASSMSAAMPGRAGA